MSIEPEVSTTKVRLTFGRSCSVTVRLATPTRTSVVPSAVGAVSAVIDSAPSVAAGWADPIAFTHSSVRTDAGGGSDPRSRNTRATVGDPLSTSSPNVDVGSAAVVTNGFRPSSVNVLSSYTVGARGSGGIGPADASEENVRPLDGAAPSAVDS